MINLFGKKQKKDEKRSERKTEDKKEKKEEAFSKKPKKGGPKGLAGKSKIAWKSLHSSLVSEKSTFLEEKGKHVFKVLKKANKTEIKKSIEDLYGVKVEKINIVNMKRKFRRLGRTEGWKPGYKKAIVTLKKGEKIESSPR